MSEDYKVRLHERLSGLEPYPAERFSGTGIVICAGGPSVFTNAYVLIHLLRITHGCTLPIEVWHFGRAEMSARMQLLLRKFGVDTVDAEAVLAAAPAAIENGWQLKAYALMWCRFEHVLMLDADQVPLRNPSELFEWDCYRQTGAVLWPDVVDILASSPIWQACDLKPRACPAIESGQLLMHKPRHWRGLQMALHLNEHAAHYYQFLYGDKDTFLLGLLLGGSDYTLIPHRPFGDVPFCLFQRDIAGEVLFQHRTGAKWCYSGAQLEMPRVEREDDCLDALANLRAQWNGLVFTPPSRSLRAREVEARLAATRLFRLVRPGESPIRLELLAESEIGIGRAIDRMNWHCEEVGGDIRLLIRDAFGPVWRLGEGANGHWAGQAEPTAAQAYLAPEHPRFGATNEASRSLAEEILSAAGFPSPVWMERRAEVLTALRMLAALEPDIGDVIAAMSERPGILSNSQRDALAAMARDLQPKPRNADLAAIRFAWPMPGRYTVDPERDI